MIDRSATDVVRIPIEQIAVVNPRTRGKHKFRQIVTNISTVGLKRPVTVVQRGTKDGKPRYDLVCGQGRLEACRQLGETTVPALVVGASHEELLLMGLAENLARRRNCTVHMLKEIGAMKERGHSFVDIARTTGLHQSYVKGIVRLLNNGEHRLIRAVERGQIPISIAVTIATADDAEVQRALTDAYESNDLRGKELVRARRVIDARRSGGKHGHRGKRGVRLVPGESIMQTYKRETDRQRLLVQKAKACENRLLFVATALKQLFADGAFVAVLQEAGLNSLPQHLAERVTGEAAGEPAVPGSGEAQ